MAYATASFSKYESAFKLICFVELFVDARVDDAIVGFLDNWSAIFMSCILKYV